MAIEIPAHRKYVREGEVERSNARRKESKR